MKRQQTIRIKISCLIPLKIKKYVSKCIICCSRDWRFKGKECSSFIDFDWSVSKMGELILTSGPPTDIEVMREGKIRNRYNQVPYLTRNTIWESDKNKRKHNTQESQEISPIPSGDYKDARYRQYSITKIHMEHE